MKITDYCDAVKQNLVLIRFNTSKVWIVSIKHSDIKNKKEDSCANYINGVGRNPDEAIMDYVKKIRGKVLVITNTAKEKQMYSIPDDLTT